MQIICDAMALKWRHYNWNQAYGWKTTPYNVNVADIVPRYFKRLYRYAINWRQDKMHMFYIGHVIVSYTVNTVVYSEILG